MLVCNSIEASKERLTGVESRSYDSTRSECKSKTFCTNSKRHSSNFRLHLFSSQTCQVLSPTTMQCMAPEFPNSSSRQKEIPERPDEFGFILDNVQSVMVLNNTNFIYFPNPVFEPVSVSGVQELKPGSPIILKVIKSHITAHRGCDRCLNTQM